MFEQNIDIEQPFIFILKQASTYGLYHIYCQNKCMGTGRVSTIELNIKLINILASRNECYISAYYNYIFNKWDIISILDCSTMLSNITEVNKHMKLFDAIHKPNYTQINC